MAETQATVNSYVEKQGLTFTTLLDEEATAARAYRVSGIPATYLIDRDGVIRERHVGPLNAQIIADYMDNWR